MQFKKPELLAPAGSMDALKAALNAGADAVYLSGKRFGARYYALNFNDVEIKEALEFAHLRGAKIYVTLNTLIKDIELKEIAEYLIFLYKIGVDAVLVQDIGVASISRKIVPELELHASTQMTIHNIEGINWAAEMGFKRIVLPREMELSEIKKISEEVNLKEIELEIFAHGALCYSYSGQCLMSSFIGGRSGNRGMCAQPCRKQYELVFGKKDEYGKPIELSTAPLKDKYLLSTRDLSLYEYLDKIVELNISALKIEGRMRSPEYVAIVVNKYRNALDSIRREKWKPAKDDIIDLKLAFNRDFTGGYTLENDHSKIMGRNRSGNRGIYAGSVIKYDKKRKEATIKIKEDIIPKKGDGIVFISPGKQNEYGMSVSKLHQINENMVKFKVLRHLKPGTGLYLTRRKSLVDDAKKIINGSRKNVKDKIPVDLDMSIQSDGTIILKSAFNRPCRSLKLEMAADYKMEKARKRPVDKETIIKQFKKTGGTPFYFKNIDITYPRGLFAPIGKLNQIRRDLFESIEKMIISSYRPSKEEIKKAHDELNKLIKKFYKCNPRLKESNPNLNAYVDNLEVLNAVAAECNKIYFNPFNLYNPIECNFNGDRLSKQIMEAYSISRENGAEFILKLPKITSTYFLDNLKYLLIHAFNAGVNRVMAHDIGTAKYVLDLNPEIHLYASSSLNIWNSESINALQSYFRSFTISPELSKEEVQNLISKVRQKGLNAQLELMVQGNLESLISKDCLLYLLEDKFYEKEYSSDLFFGIRDTKKYVFPLRLDNECRTIILNSVELSLIDYVLQNFKMGIDSVVVDLEGRNKKYAQKICSLYTEVFQMDPGDISTKNKLAEMKNSAKKVSIGGITTGNFIRGTARR